MRTISKYLVFVLFFSLTTVVFSQRDVEPETGTEQEKKAKEEKVAKEFKKEQEEYEKEHGKVTPKSRQDPNPKPVVKANDKIEKKKELEEKKDSMMLKREKEKSKKEEEVKGNAYGKDKEGLSGREFGQSRAADAKEKINMVQLNFDDKQEFIKNSQLRIENSKKRIEEARANNEISEEEYNNRLKKIANAQAKMDKLKLSIERSQQRLKELKLKLNTVYESKDQ